MKNIDIKNLSEAYISSISKEWFLVTAGNREKFNAMIANWGGIGFLWNRPVVFIFVRPERYTFDFTETNDYFSFSFLKEEFKEAHKILGFESGRDIDKVEATGLTPAFTELGTPYFEQARLTLECKKLYYNNIRENNILYPEILEKHYGEKGNLHRMYIGEIVSAFEQ